MTSAWRECGNLFCLTTLTAAVIKHITCGRWVTYNNEALMQYIGLAWNQNWAFFSVRGSWKMGQVLVASKWVQRRYTPKKSAAYKDNIIHDYYPFHETIHTGILTTTVVPEPSSHFYLPSRFRLNYASVPHLMLHWHFIQQPHSAAIIQSAHLADPLQVHTHTHSDFCLVQEYSDTSANEDNSFRNYIRWP